MAELRVDTLSVSINGAKLVKDLSFALNSGELVAMLGPNGAGKSMSLKGLLGLTPATGDVSLSGQSLASLSVAERARQIAYLPQTVAAAWSVRVRDIVALGRYAHGAAPGRLKGEDAEAVEAALTDCGLTDFADRSIHTLSGGETARVHCARAFAARTPFILADEPVAALDPAQAFRVMDLLKARSRDGAGVLVVLHDIALAARYADRLILMKEGRIQADGPTETVLTEDALGELFGIRAQIEGRRVIIEGQI